MPGSPGAEPVLATEPEEVANARALILRAFAYMQARIDPPSSMLAMSDADLAAFGELWVIRDRGRILACVVLKPRPPFLYLGRLAVDEAHRGTGLARRLFDKAEARARELGLTGIELGSRVELTENHALFRAMGFRQVRAEAHPGYDRPTTFWFQKDLT